MPPWSLRHDRKLVQVRLLTIKTTIEAKKVRRKERAKRRREKRAQRLEETQRLVQNSVDKRARAQARANEIERLRDKNYAPVGIMERLGQRRKEFVNGAWQFMERDWHSTK